MNRKQILALLKRRPSHTPASHTAAPDPATTTPALLDVTTATRQDLRRVSGIGDEMARRILRARLKTADDLKQVPGIGRKKFSALRPSFLPVVLLLLFAWAFTLPAANAEVASAIVTAVHDGDTITVLLRGKVERVRLNAIDAPELSQAFGFESRDLLSSRVLGKTVTLSTLPRRDIYGRLVATVWYADRDECRAQVDAGAAWVFYRYLSKLSPELRPLYLLALTNAKLSHRGLWSNESAIPPWDYRKQVKDAARIRVAAEKARKAPAKAAKKK